jgi:hypothetical protein
VASKVCSVEGCTRKHKGRGWCNAHYQRWNLKGDPLAPMGRACPGELTRFIRDVAVPFAGDACLPWPFSMASGGRGVIRVDGKQRPVARVVCQLAHGDPPTPEHVSAHSCGKGHLGCVNPRHLRWATNQENRDDMVLHGTRVRGEQHGSSKLTESEVRSIRDKLAQGGRRGSIAVEYSVTWHAVADIATGKTWGWLAQQARNERNRSTK